MVARECRFSVLGRASYKINHHHHIILRYQVFAIVFARSLSSFELLVFVDVAEFELKGNLARLDGDGEKRVAG